jgi:DNA-binding winged helix-turn-helix (wHTH) protein/Tfp pilus assembly protein PilF
MLKLSDLALRPDLQFGSMLVSPSRRLVEGPGGHVHVEPLIMQVFLLLLDAAGKVVTRTELFDQCWGGVIVGDDSLNRAIAKVRRIGAQVAPGLYEIETIPRTGYRLTGEVLQLLNSDPLANVEQGTKPGISRRKLVGSTAAVTALGATGLWELRSREDREFRDVMKRGEAALNSSDPADNPQDFFRRAVALRPDDARAQGLFAYSRALRAENDERAESRTSFQEAQDAINAALSVHPREPNAQLARVVLEGGTLDLAATEDRLRRILAADPNNIQVMRQLWNLLQCVGRSREALTLVERALQIDPFTAGSHFPHAQLLWITGRTAEADRVIAKALQYWPSHRFVRFARFMIFAFTNRPRAALAMIEKPETTPQNFSPESVALWRRTLPALDQPSNESIAAARRAILEAAQNLRLAYQSAMVMSALGELNTAFDITNSYFAVGNSGSVRSKSSASVRSTAWRFAPWLFTPPIAAMRVDPRFQMLVDEIGLTAYWHARNVRPDYQIDG